MKSFMIGIVFGICGLLVFSNPKIIAKTWQGTKNIASLSYSASYDFLKDVLVPQLKQSGKEIASEAEVSTKKIAQETKIQAKKVQAETKVVVEKIQEQAKPVVEKIKETAKPVVDRISSQVPQAKPSRVVEYKAQPKTTISIISE